nr:MAG TPA: helix-turn-helix domain protein [Caudoviricetes sp.]
MKPNKKLVGKRIQAIRLEKGLTLEQFGELIGASKSSISEWESGKHLPPTKSIISRWEKGVMLPNSSRLERVAELGNITVNELLYGNNEYDIEDLEQRLMEMPIEERLKLILRVLNKTVKSTKEKSSC